MSTSPNTINQIEVARRFRGPHRSANGGYIAGVLAARALGSDAGDLPTDAITVTLRQPPPLDTPLDVVELGGRRVRLCAADGSTIGQADPSDPLPEPPAAVSLAAATEAKLRYRGQDDHPFPYCFSCGTDRDASDALRLTPGPVTGLPNTVATVWRPGPGFSSAEIPDGATPPEADRVATPAIWAALDCPGAWATEFDYGRPIVLGKISGAIYRKIRVGESYAVVGHCRSQGGRKALTATAIYDDGGNLAAAAEAIWLQVDPMAFAGLLDDYRPPAGSAE